ncbi:MAG: hypothetical protein OHK0039_42330 [Bacteroidia bacterium]
MTGLLLAAMLPAQVWPQDTTQVRDLLGRAYQTGLRDPDSALLLIGEAEHLADALAWPTGRGEAANQRGMLARRRGAYDEAATWFRQALETGEAQGHPGLQGAALNNLGITAWNLRDYAQGQAYFRRALAIQRQRDDSTAIANCLSNIGMIHTAIGAYDSAIGYYTQTLAIYQRLDHGRGIATMLHNLAVSHRERGELDRSNSYLRAALLRYQQLDDATGQINTWKNIAKNYLRMGKTDSVTAYVHPALGLALQRGLLKEQMDCHEVLSDYYAAVGDWQASRTQLLDFIAVRDSQFSLDQTRQLADLKARYEADLHLADLRAAHERERRIRYVWTSATLALLLLLAAGSYAYTMRLRRNRAERLRLKAEHEAGLLRADMLAREIAFKNRALTTKAMHIAQKNEILADAARQLDQVLTQDPQHRELRKLRSFLEQVLHREDHWEEFVLHFEQVHPGFFERLRTRWPRLTPYDHRFAAYLRMNLSNKEIAALLHATLRAVDTQRYRLRKKLELDTSEDLVAWMQRI